MGVVDYQEYDHTKKALKVPHCGLCAPFTYQETRKKGYKNKKQGAGAMSERNDFYGQKGMRLELG